MTSLVLMSTQTQITRHKLVDRIFHWAMAASMFALLITGLSVPLGLKFDWLLIHWIAGLILIAVVIFHIVRASFWQHLASMWIGVRDIAQTVAALTGGPVTKPGKYSVAQRLMHHAVTVFCLAVIVTGVLMLKKVDTPILARDPYWLSAEVWGLVYVIHGLAALVFVSMIIVHIYFAVRPEKLFYLRSMIFGAITRQERNDNHDPALWSGEEK